MAEHPSYSMAILTAVGGTIGYLRARSIPSLVGGLAVSGLYGTGGYLISQNKDEGYTASLDVFFLTIMYALPAERSTYCVIAASALLLASSARRAIKFAAIPMGLSGLGLVVGGYYVNKIYRARVGY